MPRIPRSKGSLITSRVPSTAQPIGDVGAEGRALEAAGGALQDFGIELAQKRQKSIEDDYVLQTSMKTSRKALELEQKLKLEMGEDPTGHADSFAKEMEEWQEEQLQSAPTKAAGERYKASSFSTIQRGVLNAEQFENKTRASNFLNNNKDAVTEANKGYLLSPSLDQWKEDNRMYSEGMTRHVGNLVDERTANDLIDYKANSGAKSIFSGYMGKDTPEGINRAEALLKDEDFRASLDEDDLDSMMDQVKRARKIKARGNSFKDRYLRNEYNKSVGTIKGQDGAKQMAEIGYLDAREGALNKIVASAHLNIEDDFERKIEIDKAKLSFLNDKLSVKYLKSASGDLPGAIEEGFKEIEKRQELGVNQSLIGKAKKRHLANMQMIHKLQTKDPVKFISNVHGIDTGDVEGMVRKQHELGLVPSGGTAVVMSLEEAGIAGSSISKRETTQHMQNVLMEKYGPDHIAKAYNDMYRAGTITAPMLMLGEVNGDGASERRLELSNIIISGEKMAPAWKEHSNSSGIKDATINDAILANEEFRSMYDSILFLPHDTARNSKANGYKNVMSIGVKQLVMNGTDVDKAVEIMRKKVMDSNYSVIKSSDGNTSVFTLKNINGKDISESKVEKLMSFDKMDTLRGFNVDVPDWYKSRLPGQGKGLGEFELKEKYYGFIADKVEWVTNDTNTGAFLIIDNGDSSKQAISRFSAFSDVPLEVRFDEISDDNSRAAGELEEIYNKSDKRRKKEIRKSSDLGAERFRSR